MRQPPLNRPVIAVISLALCIAASLRAIIVGFCVLWRLGGADSLPVVGQAIAAVGIVCLGFSCCWLRRKRFRVRTFRRRLCVSFGLMVLLPAIASAAAARVVGSRRGSG
jgi:hypothetical protein